MPDITLCSDKECPLKLSCLRFTAKRDKEDYFFNYSPYMSDTNDCEFYYPEQPQKKK